MKRILLFSLPGLLGICFSFQATHSRSPVQKSFPQEYRLISERFPLTYGVSPNSMDLKEGFLIFCGNNLRIYSALDYSFVQAFGNDRQAPDALQQPQILRSSSPYLYLMEMNGKNKISKYRLGSSGPVLLQTGFTGVVNAMNRPYILRDSLILYDEFLPEASVKIHNLYSNAQARALPYGVTSLNDRFFDKNMGGVYANDTRIAFAYKYQDRIDFYDWQFNPKRSVSRQRLAPVINRQNQLNNVHYYGSSFMGQNYFYTLYRGVSNKVFRTDSLPRHSGGMTFYTYGAARDVLEVYDMDGLPVCRFYFDDIAPAMFVVDEEQNRLLGYRDFYRDSLLVYQLKGLPKNGKKRRESVKLPLLSFPVIAEPDAPKETSFFTSIQFHPDVAPAYWIRYGGTASSLIHATGASGLTLKQQSF